MNTTQNLINIQIAGFDGRLKTVNGLTHPFGQGRPAAAATIALVGVEVQP